MQKLSVLHRGFFLVGTVGLEPMTSCMSSMRSNQLSYAPFLQLYYSIIKTKGLSSQKRKNYLFFNLFSIDFKYVPCYNDIPRTGK